MVYTQLIRITAYNTSCSSQCSMTGVTKAHGMCNPVCGMVHIRVAHVAAVDFLSRYLNGPLPHVRHHITINKMC